MTLDGDLYRIEEGFWLAGEDHFLAHVDEHCLLVFPQTGEMHGIHSREDVAATATPSNRWRNLQFTHRQLLRATDDVVILSYRADVTRADGQPYSALIGSTYVCRPDGWKLAAHQHSPV
jgi:hypothetical protein